MSNELLSMEDELMNTRAFAKAVGVAPSSITNFVEQGRLVPAYKEVVSERNGVKHYKYGFNRSQIESARFIAKRGKTNNQLLVLCLGENQEEVDNIADITRKELADEKGLTEISSIAEYCSNIAQDNIEEIALSDAFNRSLEKRIATLLKKEKEQLKEQYMLRHKIIEEREEAKKDKVIADARAEFKEAFISMDIVSQIRKYNSNFTEFYKEFEDEAILNTYLKDYFNYLFSDSYSSKEDMLVGKVELKVILELIDKEPILQYKSDEANKKWQKSMLSVRSDYIELDNEYEKANGVLTARYAAESLYNPDDATLDKFVSDLEEGSNKPLFEVEKKQMKDAYRKLLSSDEVHSYTWNKKEYTFQVGDKYLQEKELYLKRYIAKEQKKKVDGKDDADNKLTTLFAIEKYIKSEDVSEFERIMLRVASREFGQVMIMNSNLLDEQVKAILTALNKCGVLHINLS